MGVVFCTFCYRMAEGISKPRKTNYPAGAVDIFPTFRDRQFTQESCLYPQDGKPWQNYLKRKLPCEKNR